MNRGTPKVALVSLLQLQNRMKTPPGFRFLFKVKSGKPNESLVERFLKELYDSGKATEVVDGAEKLIETMAYNYLYGIPALVRSERELGVLNAQAYWDYRNDAKKAQEAQKKSMDSLKTDMLPEPEIKS